MAESEDVRAGRGSPKSVDGLDLSTGGAGAL